MKLTPIILILLLFVSCSKKTTEGKKSDPQKVADAYEKEYSPFVGDDYPQNVYFGDTHFFHVQVLSICGQVK